MSGPAISESLAALAYYERQQMLGAVAQLAKLEQKRRGIELHERSAEQEVSELVAINAYLESFLVHFRNLLEFLAPTSATWDETVTAADFLGLPHKKALAAPTGFRKSIHKRLSHISAQRLHVPEEEKSWPVGQMVKEMEEAWSGFLELLHERHPERVSWFTRQTGRGATQETSYDVSLLQSVSAVTTASTNAVLVTGSFTGGAPDWVLLDPAYKRLRVELGRRSLAVMPG